MRRFHFEQNVYIEKEYLDRLDDVAWDRKAHL
jgi:hypothetical protein